MSTLLIATSRGLICIDENNSCAYLIDNTNGTYYGITYSEKNIFVAARRVSYAKGKGRPEEQAGVILVYNYSLELVDELLPTFPLRDLHQIYFFDNKLWAVCTYDSTVAIYDDGAWDRWYPLGYSAPIEIARKYHFNSIYSCKNRIYMAGSIDRNGIIYEYDFESRALLNKYFVGYSSHNVWIRDGIISTLSSMAGSKISLDGNIEIISRGNFVRGITVAEHFVYYGISTALNRSRREGTNLMIKKVPADSTNAVFYGIEGFGQINEIRSPGVYDYAHPSQMGEIIQTEKLNGRFSSIPVITEQIVREIPVWQSLPRSFYQRLDMIRRKKRLYKNKIL